jgi:hypothetical protein
LNNKLAQKEKELDKLAQPNYEKKKIEIASVFGA